MVNGNELERGLREWFEQEKKLANIFTSDLLKTREFQKEKLKYYDRLVLSQRRQYPFDQKLLLKALNFERQRLEKMLYPQLWQRLFRPVTLLFVGRQTSRNNQANLARQIEGPKPNLEPGIKTLAKRAHKSKKEKEEQKVAVHSPKQEISAQTTKEKFKANDATKNVSDLLPKKKANKQNGLTI